MTVVSLSLMGTGTDEDYAFLADMPAMQWLEMRGPVTLTTERICMLGTQPQLKYLKLDNVLFPRTPYGEHACMTAVFPQLQALWLQKRNPLTGNGQQSGAAGRQFLGALKSLRDLTIQVDAGSQVLLRTLDSLPVLSEIYLEQTSSSKQAFVDSWIEWASSKQPQVKVKVNTYLSSSSFPYFSLEGLVIVK